MNTCLFTGAELTPATKDEHVIPEGLCGKMKTRLCTSTEFNGLTSGMDCELVRRYDILRHRLAPLLAAKNRPGKTPWIGTATATKFTMDRYGNKQLAEAVVLSRDDEGRPQVVLSNDGRLPGMPVPTEVVQGWRDLTEPVRSSEPAQIVGAVIEVAALKSFLATWDFLLQPAADRFTRSSVLAPVRRFVRDGALDLSSVQATELSGYCLGYSFDGALGAFLTRARGACSPPKMSFEHFLAVWSDPARRTLYGAWSIFDVDVMTFRLSTDWDGPPVALCAGQGVERSQGRFGPCPLPPAAMPPVMVPGLARATCAPEDRAFAERCFHQARQEMFDAVGRAQTHVEVTADADTLRHLLAGPAEATIRQAVDKRLGFLYHDRATLPEVLGRIWTHAVAADSGEALTAASGAAIEEVYRCVFHEVHRRFGDPVVVADGGS